MLRIPEDQRALLEAWAESGPSLRIARRAWLVLAAVGGRRLDRHAMATTMPSREIQRLGRRFEALGPLALVDAKRAGRPAAVADAVLLGALDAGRSPSARELAASAGVAPDRIWRALRKASASSGIDEAEVVPANGRRRHRVQRVMISVGPLSQQVIGIAVDRGVCVVAVQPSSSAREALAIGGAWLARDPAVVASLGHLGTRPDWRHVLEHALRPEIPASRARRAEEQRAPFCELLRATAAAAPGIVIHVVAHHGEAHLCRWLAALRDHGLGPGPLVDGIRYACDPRRMSVALRELLDAPLPRTVLRALDGRDRSFFWVRGLRGEEE